MHARPRPTESLLNLLRLSDTAERRSSWRQALAALGTSVGVVGPPPLEDAEPSLLLRAVQVALSAGLADDLDWIAPGQAAVGLYELTSALPPSPARRELGRRVFARLYEGTASTFAMVATRMALGSGRALETPTLRGRIALLFDMPIGSSASADALALTLVSRRETFRRWVSDARIGPLQARRLAAKLFERAAREAVLRHHLGDPCPAELLGSPEVLPSFSLLLADREPLVWRHAAVARGLLAAVDPIVRQDIETSLDPALSPTQWRRAGVSLVALMAFDPDTALKQCLKVLHGPIAGRDPGIVATMVSGLPRVIEAEPGAAEELLTHLAAFDRSDSREAVAELLSTVAIPGFGRQAIQPLAARLERPDPRTGEPALAGSFRIALGFADRDPVGLCLPESLREALVAYDTQGARAAYDLAVTILSDARLAVDRLALLDTDPGADATHVVAVLSDLDATLLQGSELWGLLLLNRRPGDADSRLPELDEVYERLGTALVGMETREREPPATPAADRAWRRRLVCLLHLLDLEGTTVDPDVDRPRLSGVRRQAVEVLIDSLTGFSPESVRRVMGAALARSLDAVAREGSAEPSDLLLAVCSRVEARDDILAITEALTHPDVHQPFAAYLRFIDPSAARSEDEVRAARAGAGSLPTPHPEDPFEAARRLIELSHSLGTTGQYRGEALRQVLLRVGRTLQSVAAATCLPEIVSAGVSGPDSSEELQRSLDELRQLVVGARRRVMNDDGAVPSPDTTEYVRLSEVVRRIVSEGQITDPGGLERALAVLGRDLPSAISARVASVARRIPSLPIAATEDAVAIPLERRRAALPDWLLPGRTMGAFYVVRALGSGGGSSVFVARRTEERHDSGAPLYALKVPEYDPTTARSLTEQEFLELFREEAGALLALPRHANLARFVTFDLAARPKPILVMELIVGTSLDRLVRARALTVDAALAHLDGILAGLGAMHEAGLAHLDLKPSNVILRDERTPVLVDFGLAGRRLRPGCGSLEYCAPEILGILPDGFKLGPQPADIYAFAAMSFEILTTRPLIGGTDERDVVSKHVSHDGWPARLLPLRSRTQTKPLADVLSACLRADPRRRPEAAEVRARLREAGRALQGETWPIEIEDSETPPEAGLD